MKLMSAIKKWIANLIEKWKLRPKRSKRIFYGRWLRYNWDIIEQINKGLEINHDTCYVDYYEYLRWKSSDR